MKLLLVAACLLALLAAPTVAGAPFRKLLNADTPAAEVADELVAAAGIGPGPLGGSHSGSQPISSQPSYSPPPQQEEKREREQQSSISVTASFTVPIDTDLVRATMVIDSAQYAYGYDPRQQAPYGYATAASADAPAPVPEPAAAPADAPAAAEVDAAHVPTGGVKAPGESRYPSEKELAGLQRKAQEDVLDDLNKLMDYLKQRAYKDKVERIRSEGVRVEPVYDYGCRSPAGVYDSALCDYSRPMVVGYRASARVTFDAELGSAYSIVSGAMEKRNGGARLESLVDVASELKRDKAELQAIREAIKKIVKKVRAAIQIIEEVLEDQGIDVKLVKVKCRVKVEPEKRHWYSLAGGAGAMQMVAGSYSDDSAQAMVPRMSGSTVDLEVECTIKFAIIRVEKKY
jgi:stage V sporulation protein SpoVS